MLTWRSRHQGLRTLHHGQCPELPAPTEAPQKMSHRQQCQPVWPNTSSGVTTPTERARIRLSLTSPGKPWDTSLPGPRVIQTSQLAPIKESHANLILQRGRSHRRSRSRTAGRQVEAQLLDPPVSQQRLTGPRAGPGTQTVLEGEHGVGNLGGSALTESG